MQTSAPKRQKTSSDLNNLHVDDWEDGRKKIGTGTLHSVFRHLQGSDWGLARLKKQSQCNESSFRYQIGLKIQKTKVGAQKIDGTTLETYGMVVFILFVSDKDGRERFLEKSFLLADVKLDV